MGIPQGEAYSPSADSWDTAPLPVSSEAVTVGFQSSETASSSERMEDKIGTCLSAHGLLPVWHL
jgi:hypothetical protein